MYLLPLFFALFMAIRTYNRNGMDLSFFVSNIYFISSICACVLLTDNGTYYLEDYSKFKITIVPTILYVIFMFLSIYPLYVFNTNRKRTIKATLNSNYLNIVVAVYVVVVVLMIVLFGSTIPERLVLSNMKEFRSMNYIEDTSLISDFSFGKKVIALLAIGLSTGASALLVLFFYCLAFTNKSRLFLIFLLFLSMLPIFNGILNMDRSNTFYWILLFIMGFFLFKPYLPIEKKLFIYKMAFGVIGILVLYFMAVSIARFTDSDSGTANALLDYIGQPYLNFCNEWNCLEIEGISFVDLFPVFKLFPSLVSEIKIINPDDISTNGFHTLPGSFIYTLGHVGVVVMPFVFFALIYSFSRRKTSVLNIRKFMILFIVFTIPQTSIISYYYANEWRFIDVFVFIYIASRLCRGIKLKSV